MAAELPSIYIKFLCCNSCYYFILGCLHCRAAADRGKAARARPFSRAKAAALSASALLRAGRGGAVSVLAAGARPFNRAKAAALSASALLRAARGGGIKIVHILSEARRRHFQPPCAGITEAALPILAGAFAASSFGSVIASLAASAALAA